jgi:hypothetical protein
LPVTFQERQEDSATSAIKRATRRKIALISMYFLVKILVF